MHRRKIAVTVAALAVATATITPIALSPAVASPKGTVSHQTAHRIGSPRLRPGTGASGSGELRPNAEADAAASTKRVANGQHKKPSPPPAPSGITGDSLSVQNGSAGASWAGINHRQQRLADNGNQWSLVPPDQGLCVGNGQVVEMVNNAFRVYDTSGTPLTDVTAFNPFLFGDHEADRTVSPIVASPHQVGDPSCVYDAGSNRFYMAVFDYKANSAGDVLGPTWVDIAVSPAGTALGSWGLYQIDVTNDGSGDTPSHPDCPCLGDYPHIGTDATGFYITTNEYSWFAPTEVYNGANIYALSKAKFIAGGDSIPVWAKNTGRAADGEDGFTLAPALSNGTSYASAANGTMYFLSSDAAEEVHNHVYQHSTQILLWSLTNTASLDSSSPDLALHHDFITVGDYYLPPKSNQKVGSVPLADCLNLTACSKAVLGTPDKFKEYEFPIDSSDTRMLQAAYAGGQVWGALDTAVDVGGKTKAGVAYYVVNPTSTATSVSGTLAKQQTIVVPNNNITYPALGVTSAGKAVMALSLVGTDYYPSAAYVKIDTTNGAGPVNIVGAGLGPSDDFSGYRGFQYNIPRWGDYGAAAVVGGTVWIASEYIGQTCTLSQYVASPFGSCGGTRTALANWGTFISSVTP